jgi:acyl-CoA thioester hydrolase
MRFAYHTHYLIWCEVGRTDFIRELGVAYAEVEQSGVLLAVAEASIRYQKAARYDDVIEVQTRVERVQSRAVTFAYQITRIEPAPVALLATALTRLIALDAQGSPRTLPTALLDAFRSAAGEPD